MDIKCDYCNERLLISRPYIYKLIKNCLIKRSNYHLNKLCTYIRMSPLIEQYIRYNHRDLFIKLNTITNIGSSYYLVSSFLDHHPSTKQYSGFHCRICNRNACNFHYIYGGIDKDLICGFCYDGYNVTVGTININESDIQNIKLYHVNLLELDPCRYDDSSIFNRM
jgi:hypothetical protein